MNILRGEALQAYDLNRIPDAESLTAPDHFHDASLGIRAGMRYTLERAIPIAPAHSTFWNIPIQLQALPHKEKRMPTFVSHNGYSIPSVIEHVTTRFHNIAVCDDEDGVGILEHPNALQTALGVDMNLHVSSGENPPSRRALQMIGAASPGISLPTNAECNQPYLTALHNNLRSLGKMQYLTVSEPVGFQFGDDSYIVLEPDDGSHQLIVDQQMEYPDIPALGNQRMRVAMTPEFFSFIASARTPAIRARARALQVLGGAGMSRFPFTSLGMDNVVLVTKNGIQNPKEKFETDGMNVEPLCHELIDKIGWLKFVENQFEGRRFAGTVTLRRTNHKKEITAARALCGGEILQEESVSEKSIDVRSLKEAA